MNTRRPLGVLRNILPENGYLGSLDPTVRQEIFSKAALVSDELKLWAAAYSTIRTVRTFPLALSVAAAAPFATPSELLDTARVSLWVFTLDQTTPVLRFKIFSVRFLITITAVSFLRLIVRITPRMWQKSFVKIPT